MTITRVASTGVVAATAARGTSASVAWPAGYTPTAGDWAVVTCSVKPSTATWDTVTDWTLFANVVGGTGTAGTDVGTTRIGAYRKLLVGGDAAPVITASSSPSAVTAVIDIYRTTSKGGWIGGPERISGSYSTHAANPTATMTSGFVTAPVVGSMIQLCYSSDTDATSLASAETLTQTGLTFGSISQASRFGNSTGLQNAVMTWSTTVLSGSNTNAPTFSFTFASTSCGPMLAIRLTEQPTTTVTSELDTRWQVRNTVASNGFGDFRWAVRGTVASSTDLRWAVRSALSSSVDLRWVSLNAASATLDLRWQVRNAVASALDLRWAGAAQVANSLGLLWGVRSPVASALDLPWAVRSAISNASDLRWLVANVVTGSTDLRWALAGAVSGTLDLRWGVRSSLQSAIDLRWAAKAEVNSALDLRWTVRAAVLAGTDIRWAVRSSVGASVLDLPWVVYGGAVQSLDLRWNVDSTSVLVAGELDLRWRSLNRVTGETDLRWRSATSVSAPLQALWTVRASVSAPVDARWVVRSVVQAPVSLPWALRAGISGSVDLRWAQRAAIANATDLRWASRSLTASSISTLWAIRGVVAGTLDLRWRLGDGIRADLGLLWVVRGPVTGSLALLWALEGAPDPTDVPPGDVQAVLTLRVSSVAVPILSADPVRQTVARPVPIAAAYWGPIRAKAQLTEEV